MAAPSRRHGQLRANQSFNRVELNFACTTNLLTQSSPCEDYRARGKAPGKSWIKSMTLPADEFIRRFLIHVLPSGFHRIRHYGLFSSQRRAANIARLRELIAAAEGAEKPIGDSGATSKAPQSTEHPETSAPAKACPCCAGRMRVIETFARGATPSPVICEWSSHRRGRARPVRQTDIPLPDRQSRRSERRRFGRCACWSRR
jgi:hypothetical protein